MMTKPSEILTDKNLNVRSAVETLTLAVRHRTVMQKCDTTPRVYDYGLFPTSRVVSRLNFRQPTRAGGED
jgi:hypothetical protein